MKMIRILTLKCIALFTFITFLSLSGCGGGGGGGGGGGDESKGEPESALIATITLPTQNVTIPTGSAYTFKGQATGGVSPYKYTWSFGGGAATPTTQGAEVTATFNTAGSYTITLTVSDAKGTTASDTVTVTVETPAPVPTITSPSSGHTVVAGSSISFSGSVTGGEVPISLRWSFGGGIPDVEGVDACTVQFNTVGDYTVTFTATDKNNATRSSSIIIHVGVPDLFGRYYRTEEEQLAVRQTILDAGLSIGSITWRSSASYDDNTIMSHDPAAGSVASPGTPVNLVITSGISSHHGVLTAGGIDGTDSIWHMEHQTNVYDGRPWDGYSITPGIPPSVSWSGDFSESPEKIVTHSNVEITEAVDLLVALTKDTVPHGKMSTSYTSYSFTYYGESGVPTDVWFAKGTWELESEDGSYSSGLIYLVQDTLYEVRGCIEGDISGTYYSNTYTPSVFQISTISIDDDGVYELDTASEHLGYANSATHPNIELNILDLDFDGAGHYYDEGHQTYFGEIFSSGVMYILPGLNAGAFHGIWKTDYDSGRVLSFVSLRPALMENMPSLEGISDDAAEDILFDLFFSDLGIINYENVYSAIIPIGRIVEQSPLQAEILGRTGTINLAVSAPTSGWTYISSGFSHSLGIKNDGTLWAWGSNESGQLGTGSDEEYSLAPVQIGTDSWLAVSAGESHSLALKSDHTLWAWGSNDFGQLGIGSEYPEGSDVPVQVSIQDITWKAIAAGGTHSLAITEGGDLWAWGYNERGQLGAGSDFSGDRSFDPVMTSNSGGWTALAAGYEHSLGIESGILYAWGDDSYGQLGIGGMGTEYEFFKALPTPVDAPSDVEWASISAGEYFSLGITTQNLLYTWGINNLGQLGFSTQDYETSPVIVGNDWFTADCGYDHVIAVKNDGSLWAWGNNDHGQIGNGFVGVQHEPCQIGSLHITGPVSAGGYYSMALEDDIENDGLGSILTWGANDKGQLGDRTYLDVYIPSQI